MCKCTKPDEHRVKYLQDYWQCELRGKTKRGKVHFIWRMINTDNEVRTCSYCMAEIASIMGIKLLLTIESMRDIIDTMIERNECQDLIDDAKSLLGQMERKKIHDDIIEGG